MIKPKYKCPECGCDTAVRVWTAHDFGECMVACVKCGAKIKEFEKEEMKIEVFRGGIK